MNLSVDEVFVDTYSVNSRSHSIMTSRDFLNNEYIELCNIETRPDQYLSGVIQNNGVVKITNDDEWIVTKRLVNNGNRMDLEYKHL